MSVDGALAAKLKLRSRSAEWEVWEHKTFNIHRGVLHWRASQQPSSFSAIANAIEQQVKDSFQVAWWRGFGFGALIESATLPADVASIESAIHTRANAKGTWQWVILAGHDVRTVVGVHTWKEGYLSDTYRQLVRHYEADGYLVGSFKKEKDKLMQFLTQVARLKGVTFSEFTP